jgi:VCBS repeat-containing protein
VDTFTYHANDGLADSNIATVTITVNGVNDAPVAVDDPGYVTDEDAQLDVILPGVLGNDTDADGDPLTAVLDTGPSNGTLTLNLDGSFSYTPNLDFAGTVTITVNEVNDAPVAVDDLGYTTDEETQLDVILPGVLGNDTDAEGDPLTAVLDTGPANGTLTLNLDGSFSYTPNADFAGVDTFTYHANDGLADSNVATVTITVNEVNDAPVAVDDPGYTTDEETQLDVVLPGVLGNDTDAEGDPLTAVLDTGPANGTLTLILDGSFSYTPNVDFAGVDTFTYHANDGLADSNVATVTITVNGVNDAPVAVDDPGYATDEDVLLNEAAPGVLGNDSDAEGDPLTAVLDTGPSNGTLTLNADGSFSYTPNADFSGVDTFTYHANDGLSDSNIATVTITVNGVNDAPVAVDDPAYVTDEDVSLNEAAPGVLGNDTDAEGDPLTAVLDTGPSNGTLTLNADGSFLYTPNLNFNGVDSFTYHSNDGSADSNVATVTITVAAVSTTLTFPATDDAYVDSKKPTANNGSSSLLQVRAGSKELDSYLKFAVSGAGTVVDAKLRLWVEKESPDGGSIHSVSNDYSGTAIPWDETGLVWNNAPAIGGAPLATAGTVLVDTWVEFDVTAAMAGEGDYSFGLSSDISNAVRYSSKEGANPPELVVTFD